MERILIWYSCGAASAVAAKLAIKKYKGKVPLYVGYCDTGSEHPDNVRFLRDCESWFDEEVHILRSSKYQDIWDVFEKTRYIVGVRGARCTTELKKKLREKIQLPTDVQVFGFTSDEQQRAEKFDANHLDVYGEYPLIENKLDKAACFEYLKEAGIELPVLYTLGYRNNNCLGCCKGGAGYWNKIRRDFPEVFEKMAKVERKLDVAINKSYKGDGKRKRVFLDELDPAAGRYTSEPSLSCGFDCKH